MREIKREKERQRYIEELGIKRLNISLFNGEYFGHPRDKHSTFLHILVRYLRSRPTLLLIIKRYK